MNSAIVTENNYPFLLLNSTLFLTIGLVVSITTRALGALPVFVLFWRKAHNLLKM